MLTRKYDSICPGELSFCAEQRKSGREIRQFYDHSDAPYLPLPCSSVAVAFMFWMSVWCMLYVRIQFSRWKTAVAYDLIRIPPPSFFSPLFVFSQHPPSIPIVFFLLPVSCSENLFAARQYLVRVSIPILTLHGGKKSNVPREVALRTIVLVSRI